MPNRLIHSLRNLREKLWNTKAIRKELSDLKFEMAKYYLLDKIMHCESPGISDKKYCDKDIIVSLTTHGKRIFDVAYTIESIMQQTMLPNRIILNLDKSFKDAKLPLSVSRQINRGLEIKIVDDIRSYKKLIPTLISNPDALIITIDDDLLYDHDIIERLFNSYLKHPGSIHALRTHTIRFDSHGYPMAYNKWKLETADTSNPFHLFPTTGGGVLFPPGCFNHDVFDRQTFMQICPTADDVWFHAMAVLNGTEIVKVPTRSTTGCEYVTNPNGQDIGLHHVNAGKTNNNDIQIRAVYDKFGIFKILTPSILSRR